MKVYKKLIKPMIGFPGQNGEPKRVPIESEEKWYPEENREALVKKYKHFETTFETLVFEDKYEEVEIPEIVRCKNCKYNEGRCRGLYIQFITCYKTGTPHKEDWFCADGERK